MSTVGILFFISIIVSYFFGMWAGMKIEKPKVKPKVITKTKKVVSPVKPSQGSVIPAGSIAAKASARDSAKPKTKVRN
jgi:hypothetical protein